MIACHSHFNSNNAKPVSPWAPNGFESIQEGIEIIFIFVFIFALVIKGGVFAFVVTESPGGPFRVIPADNDDRGVTFIRISRLGWIPEQEPEILDAPFLSPSRT